MPDSTKPVGPAAPPEAPATVVAAASDDVSSGSSDRPMTAEPAGDGFRLILAGSSLVFPSHLSPDSIRSLLLRDPAELDRRKKAIKSLFQSSVAQEALEKFSGVRLDDLIELIEKDQLRFYSILHAYFENITRPLITGDKDGSYYIALFGRLATAVDDHLWLYKGLSIIDPRFAANYVAAKGHLSETRLRSFLEALKSALVPIDAWIMSIRSLQGDWRGIYITLKDQLGAISGQFDVLRDILDLPRTRFSSLQTNGLGIFYWEMKARFHYIANKFAPMVGYLAMISTNPGKAEEYIGRIIRDLKNYISLAEKNPFLFLSQMLLEYPGWALTSGVEAYFKQNAPAWFFVVIENMIQNAMRAHLKKDGRFEGKISLVSQDALPSSTPDAIKKGSDKWDIVAIEDNGMGIPANVQEGLFSTLVHGDLSSPGHGEGLLDAYNLLVRRGGFIWFDTILGQGTAFYLAVSKEGVLFDGGGAGGGTDGELATVGGGEELALLGTYESTKPAQALSLGARMMLEEERGSGNFLSQPWQVPAYGGRGVFTPVPVLVVP